MFGNLKKKLKSVIEKFSGKIDEEPKQVFKEEVIQEKPVEPATEQHIEPVKEPDQSSDLQEPVQEIIEPVKIEEPKEEKPEIKEVEEIIEEKPEIKETKSVHVPEKEEEKIVEKIEELQESLEKEEEIVVSDIEKEKEKLEKKDTEKIIEIENIIREDEKIIQDIEHDKEKLDEIKDILQEKKQDILEQEKPLDIEEQKEPVRIDEKIVEEEEPVKEEEKITEPKPIRPTEPILKEPDTIKVEEIVGPKQDEKIMEPIIEPEKKDSRSFEESEQASLMPSKQSESIKEEPKEIILNTDELIGPEKTLKEKSEEKAIGPEIIEKEIEEILEKPVEKEASISIFKKIREKTLTEDDIKDVLDGIQHALLENDVAYEVTDRICADVKNDLIGKSVSRGKIEDVVESSLRQAVLGVLDQDKIDLERLIEEKEGPFLIMFLGFNGVGKTTNLAKVANRFKKYNPVIAAGDTFRAASIEQLEIHAKNVGVDLVKHRYGADSAAVIFDAMKHAGARGKKLVLADTAGRSHSNVNLMDELKKVCKVNKPDMKILVLDAITGNDIYEQAKRFDEAVGVDAILLSKTDVYEKGGSALSASYTIKKPVIFMGTGQEYKDLEEFDAKKIADNLLG